MAKLNFLPHATALALGRAERAGFKIAVGGRTIAILLIAIAYLLSYYFPINLAIFGMTAVIALGGLTTLKAIGTKYERHARYVLFAFDASVVTVLLAFVPLSSGGHVPQNLVFLTSSMQHYYLVVAASVLTLSPPLVLWTGAWSAGGLLFATWWIASGMDMILSYSDLPISPSPEIYLRTVLNPNFLGIASRVQEALIISLVTGIAALAVHRARKVVSEHAEAKARQRHVQNLFSRYVPAAIVNELVDEGQLAPQTRRATLLFADIKDFTKMSQRLQPIQLVKLLNEFFSAITEIVDQNGGVVINYIGDAVLVSFNAPLAVERPADRAVRAAQDMLAAVETRQFLEISLQLRIGIATGIIAAGTVGAGERQTYTVYGDAVNLAQRLQALNKEMGTNCLVSGETVHHMSDAEKLTSLGSVPIRHFGLPVAVYKLDR
ncbi:adenylate/guanylate cyclase domain-containing protein [Agrobacterium pusense]|uniref:adenylate/guanylate cyclase domain-containing protein n=1 Tax=Agrobacterium pusense TaxID=648995 RepID=UPI003FD2A949